MRTHAITINDAEIFWRPGSLRCSRSKDSRGSCSFTIRGDNAMPSVGDRVGIFDHGIRIWGGSIDQIRLTPIAAIPASEAWYDCLGVAWEHRLERRHITAAFHGKSAGEIVQAILESDWEEGRPREVHVGAIVSGASADELGTVIFRGLSYYAAIEDLAKRSNYIFYIDPDQYFYFTPRLSQGPVELEITAANKNYRSPEIVTDRSEHFNKVSIAISYDAFAPFTLELKGDETYPSFQVYDPADEEKKPVPVDVIRKVSVNGVDQEFSVKDAGQTTPFYYTPGDSTIEWDPAILVWSPARLPAPEDQIIIEFYKVGANVLAAQDNADIAINAVRDDGTGIYEAYLEDMDLKDASVAQQRLTTFLDLHCVGRQEGKSIGDFPQEYAWTMYSDELLIGPESMWPIARSHLVPALFPGRIVRLAPSTPLNESQDVLITDVDIEDVAGSARRGIAPANNEVGMLRYTIRAIDVVRKPDYVDFFKALAETGGSLSSTQSVPNEHEFNDRRLTFGWSGTVALGYGSIIELSLAPGWIFRCVAAYIEADTAPTGATIMVDLAYSADNPTVPIGSRTWSPVFESSAGDLVLPIGQSQIESPWSRFYGFPSALDLPSRALIRPEIKQVGSTVAGADLKVQLLGELRKAT